MYVFKRQFNETVPVDVLVAGGGIAGFSAAVAAARQGARTLLVEQFAVLGGQATSGGVGSFSGETAGQGEVFDRLIEEMTALDAIEPYEPYGVKGDRPFDHELLAYVLQEVALDEGVELLLLTHFADADVADGRIGEVLLHGPSGLEVVEPKCVVDATGEGVVAQAAGYPCEKGRPGDEAQLPMSMMFFMRHAPKEIKPQSTQGHPRKPRGSALSYGKVPDYGKSLPVLPKGRARYESVEQLPMTSIWPEPDGKIGIKVKVIHHDATDTRSLTAAEIEARRTIMSIADYLQRTDFPTYKYDYAAPRIGIREGWRVVGEYVLSEADLRAGRRFPDGIALGVYYLDAMSPDTDKRIYMEGARAQVPPYHIPYRSLVPQGARNLLVAGRCFSCDQMALSSARIMPTCSMMGHAAGIAAAWHADSGTDVVDIDVEALRQELIDRGAVI